VSGFVLSARGGPVGRLAEFFRRGGYEVDVEDDVLWLRSDRVSGVVRVVGDDAGASELLSAVIEAARDAAAGFLAYIAAPKNIVDRVGEHVFRLHGLGLLKYTDYEVYESVSPRIRETPQPRSASSTPDIGAALEKLLRKVEAIESRLDRQVGAERPPVVERVQDLSINTILGRIEVLERRVAGLEELAAEVAELRDMVRRLLKQGVQPPAENTPAQTAAPAEAGGLPSFVSNNPWVEILSRKSRR
jgi:AcrR family transcriptional regulator